MKKKWIIVTIIIAITACVVLCALVFGVTHLNKQRMISSFTHKDVKKIKFDYDNNDEDYDYYFGYYNEELKHRKRPYNKYYYAALIDFPDKKIIIEENEMRVKAMHMVEGSRTYSVLYFVQNIEKEQEEDYISYYLNVVHDNSCGAELQHYKSLGDNYYYVIYENYDEC